MHRLNGTKEFIFSAQKTKFLIVAITICSCLLVFSIVNESFAVQYSNYTSDKYKIQFQYPSHWTITERTNRFEEAFDIQISNNKPTTILGIIFTNDLIEKFGTADLQSAIDRLLKDLEKDYTHDYRTIEPTSFLNIDGQRTGTYLIAFKEKYSTDPVSGATQQWVTFVGNKGYHIQFVTSQETFDSLENTQIRDHFIKSIKFLDASNQTAMNMTNRFG